MNILFKHTADTDQMSPIIYCWLVNKDQTRFRFGRSDFFLLLHFAAPVADAPRLPGESWCGKAGCRPLLGPSPVSQGLDLGV